MLAIVGLMRLGEIRSETCNMPVVKCSETLTEECKLSGVGISVANQPIPHAHGSTRLIR